MKLNKHGIEFSISDVIRYFRSPYSSWATWANLQKPGYIFVENDMVQNSSLLLRSEENEDSAKRYLINNHDEVKTISNPLNALHESQEYIEKNIEVIVQPTLKRDNFIGRADFLIFNKEQSLYEVMDAKLAKQIKSEFLLQVCGYTWMLETYQNKIPKYGWFFLGNEEVETFRINEFYRFFIDLKEEFLDQVNNYSLDNQPKPRKSEVFEEYSDAANLYWKENQSLELIADISSRQIDLLEKENYKTIDDVASMTENSLSKISTASLDKLKRQAFAQVNSTEDKTFIDLRNGDESIHFLHSLLPPENPGDIYFDLEGYPFYDITSEYTMEYLYGVAFRDEKNNLIFKDDLWAESQEEEEIIFSKFIAWVENRIKEFPNLKIYHYAHYEKTSLLKSAQKFGKHEIEVDRWLNENRFVDLYEVVKKSFIVGKDSYSLKRIEEIAGYKRELDLNSGIDSIYYFEKYLATRDQKLKKEILLYNRDDCVATEKVCKWLRDQQQEYLYNFDYIEEDERTPSELDLELLELEQKIININNPNLSQQIIEYISTMSGYFRREDRVKWQENFRLKQLPIEDKVNDSSAFGYMSLIDTPAIEDNKCLLTYEILDGTFKKVSKGDSFVLLAFSNEYEVYELYATVEEVALSPFRLILSMSEKNYKENVLDSDNALYINNPSGYIHPFPHNYRKVASKSQSELIAMCSNYIETSKLPKLVEKLLKNENQQELVETDNKDIDAEKIFDLSINLNNSFLTIQGPPGTGKSTMLGEVIYKLYKKDKSIGIIGPSYKAALNLLKKVSVYLNENERALFYISGKSNEIEEELKDYKNIELVTSISKKRINEYKIIGTYSHRLADKTFFNEFDYVVIDEVGQVPMVTTLSIVNATDNLILIGDPNQLPQIKNGIHPNNNGLSTMEYLIGNHRTIPESKGLFLNKTFRMHSDVNSLVSNYFYNDLLTNHKITDSRTLKLGDNNIKSSGIQFISVPHLGNTQASFEEVEKVHELVNVLQDGEIIVGGESRPITASDILIVSPYNSQVYELQKSLGKDYKVGTVDKFQGQEAPIVIVSLTASNYEEAPRGIDFVLNFNRINVAISRSQCLSIVVGSPALTHLQYQSLNSIKLTNLHRTIMSSS